MVRAGYPLYLQLRSWLMGKIESGEWPEGTMIPTEQELIAIHGVSRTTVRQALQDLVGTGNLVRQQGRGTFVARRESLSTSSPLYGFFEEFDLLGRHVSVASADLSLIRADAVVAAHLHLAENAVVVRVFRLVHEGDEPIFYDESFLPESAHAILAGRDVRQLQIYRAMEQHGVTISSGEQTITAQAADQTDAALLRISAGQPVLHIERTTRDVTGRPLEYACAHYRAHSYEYRVRLVRQAERAN